MRETETKAKKRPDTALISLLLFMALGYLLLHDLMGGTLLQHCDWDSYTLQAMAWREGRMDLGQNYDWLELAIFEGKYYVSFPPLPSVLMLPLTFLFGYNTPNNLVLLLLTMGCAAAAYRLARLSGLRPFDGAVAALLLTWGSNLMWMSMQGGVWFLAQGLNMLLLLLSALAAAGNRRGLAYLCVALSVGCRPFSAVAFLPLFLWFYQKDRQKGKGFLPTATGQWKAWIPVVLVAAALMWYNYARFGSTLEFGHNYLPEFLESEKGQFDPSYIGENLLRILRPVTLGEGLALEYPVFDGFLFFVANPFFLWMFVRIYRNLRAKAFDPVRVGLLAAQALNLVLLCAHKTFGGWQFGARYTCDLLPMALCYVCLSPPAPQRAGGEPLMAGAAPLRWWEKAVAVFGVAFNVYGALAMTFLHG